MRSVHDKKGSALIAYAAVRTQVPNLCVNERSVFDLNQSLEEKVFAAAATDKMPTINRIFYGNGYDWGVRPSFLQMASKSSHGLLRCLA